MRRRVFLLAALLLLAVEPAVAAPVRGCDASPSGRVPVLAWPPGGVDPGCLQGRLVTLRGPWTVQQSFRAGRFHGVALATGGRVLAPTNVLEPGPAARALALANARRSLVLELWTASGDSSVDPVDDEPVRAGDTLAEVTGVMEFGRAPGRWPSLAAWHMRSVHRPHFVRANPRAAAPAPVGGDLRVASANVDNFFRTLAGGRRGCGPRRLAIDCRGARDAAGFERQRAKIVAMLAAIDADVVALMEIENDDDGAALRSLVDALNRHVGAPAWAAVDQPAGARGSDAIRIGLLYKPARVRLLGPASGDHDPVHSRPPLAQAFATLDGARRFNLLASHFKSRRCDGATGAERDRGDLQGCWNARRVAQARALARFAQAVARANGVAHTLLVGDFNAYAHEDPLLRLVASGFADQAARFEPGGYSYVYDGAAGRLDGVFANASLAARVTGVTTWHVDADEPEGLADTGEATPWRASDHDPVVIGLRLDASLTRGRAAATPWGIGGRRPGQTHSVPRTGHARRPPISGCQGEGVGARLAARPMARESTMSLQLIRRFALALALQCGALAANAWPLGVLHLVHETPVATIRQLHELHTSALPQPSVTTGLGALATPSLAAIGREQPLAIDHFGDVALAHKPGFLETIGMASTAAPATPSTLRPEPLAVTLFRYQSERGLRATGLLDAATGEQLRQDMHDRDQLALAKQAIGGDRQVAILRPDFSNGMAWRLTVDGCKDVQFNVLEAIGADLDSPSGERPVVFVTTANSAETNKFQSSLRMGRGRAARPMPIVLSGEPGAALALLRPGTIDLQTLAHRMAGAPLLRSDQNFYKEVFVPGGSNERLKIGLWAKSKEQALRLAAAFIDFAALQFPRSEGLAEFAARFRDYLFELGYDLQTVGVGFGEMTTNQWVLSTPRREARRA